MDAAPLPLHRLIRFTPRLVPADRLRHDQRRSFFGLILMIVLLAALLRAPDLAADRRFQPDEALYATFARQITLHADPLLTDQPLDKPPLQFFAMTASFALLGVSEFAARLPAFIASLLSIAALFALARRLYGTPVALIAALLLALSPFDRAFATTAYTDPLLTLFILLACLAGVTRRWGWMGALLAAALWAKPTALQWVPLALLLAASRGFSWRSVQRFTVAFAVGVGLLALWSAARGIYPDFWTLNSANNNPGRFIRANEVWPRFYEWGKLLNTISPLIGLAWLAPAFTFRRRDQAALYDLLLTGYTLFSVTALWLIAFNTYDRYLHTLVPFLLLLLARLLNGLRMRIGWGITLAAILALTFLTPVLPSAADTAYRGIDQLASALNQLPAGSTVYEHWLGWELHFYLTDKPQIQLVWLPGIVDLFPLAEKSPVYFAASEPQWSAWQDELRQRGYTVRVLARFYDYSLLQVSR